MLRLESSKPPLVYQFDTASDALVATILALALLLGADFLEYGEASLRGHGDIECADFRLGH